MLTIQKSRSLSHRGQPFQSVACRPRRFRQRCQAVQAIDARLQRIVDWSNANGVQADKLAVVQDLATDASVIAAAKDISAGDAVISVPESAWITPGLAQQSAIGKYVSDLEPWLQLALLLIAERSNAGSKMQPYISSLPSQMNSPLFWTDEELRMLQGTQLLESVMGYKQFFREQYEQLDEQLSSQNRSVFPADTFSYSNFAWAVATVRSQLHAPLDVDPVALVPLADMLPHRRAANTTWKLKSAGLFGKGKVLVVEATRTVRQGEALVMDYGQDKLDNAVLLDHGVLDTTSPKGGYSLTLTLPESDQYYADKLDILERNSLSGSSSFTILRGQEPPAEMMGFLRLMQLTGSDCFLLESIFESEVWDFMCSPVSESNEAAVCQAMMEGAKEALAGYCSTIDEDLMIIRDGQVAAGSRAEVAVKVRLGEKEALDSLLGYFEGRATDLRALEYYQERRLKRLGLLDEEGKTTYDSFFKDGIA